MIFFSLYTFTKALALHSDRPAHPGGFHLTNHSAYPNALPSRRIGPRVGRLLLRLAERKHLLDSHLTEGSYYHGD